MLGTAKSGANERAALKEMSPRNQQKARALGLTSATGLVIGSIIGTGVFTMPAVLAGAGTSSLLVLLVIAIGALLLAALFGQLTKRVFYVDALFGISHPVVLKFLPLLFAGVVGWFFARTSTSARSTPQAAASTRPSGSRPGWPCSPSSASRSRRSPPSWAGAAAACAA